MEQIFNSLTQLIKEHDNILIMYVLKTSVVFHDAKLANFAISTLQNQYYFWFKVC